METKQPAYLYCHIILYNKVHYFTLLTIQAVPQYFRLLWFCHVIGGNTASAYDHSSGVDARMLLFKKICKILVLCTFQKLLPWFRCQLCDPNECTTPTSHLLYLSPASAVTERSCEQHFLCYDVYTVLTSLRQSNSQCAIIIITGRNFWVDCNFLLTLRDTLQNNKSNANYLHFYDILVWLYVHKMYWILFFKCHKNIHKGLVQDGWQSSPVNC